MLRLTGGMTITWVLKFFVHRQKVHSFVESMRYNLGISNFFFIFTELKVILKNKI